MNLRADLGRVGAIAWRDFQAERTYQFRHFMRLFQIAIAAGIVYYLSKLVVDPPQLEVYDGGYFEFAMIGLMVMSIATLGVTTFNANIMAEQSVGTMEVLLATPTPLPVLLAGSFVFPLVLTAIDVLLYLIIGLWVLGSVGLPLVGLGLSIPLLALTLTTFCAFGIAGAAIVVLAKRGDPITGPLLQLTAVLSGALFPVSVFPPIVEVLARALPAYYGINGLREALLGRGPWTDVLPDLAILAAFSVVLIPISLAIFSRAVAAARRAGTLGNY